ncbi:hypothetical protein [Kineococcus sp. R86509]|uniref:hypothetical protein n=1 Tax=Kineococcus sp. R86509 TaxID=3093851 RepID=UPI0036D27A5A
MFFDRKRGEGKSSMEALRALKRRLSNVVYRQMLADASGQASSIQPDPQLDPIRSETTTEPALVVSPLAAPALAPPMAAAVVTGPGGQAGAAFDSSATDCDPGVGSSDEPLPGPAGTSISTRASRRKRPLT